MRNGSFHKSPEKTHSKVKNILWGMNFLMMEDNFEKGIIKAKTLKKLFKPSIVVNVNLKVIDENTTQVFVKAEADKHFLKPADYKLSQIEESILNRIG